MPTFTIPSTIPLKIIYVLLGALTLFQLALIFGVPWGHAAWGGQYRVLPTLYRFGSASSILLYGLFLWVFHQREKHPSLSTVRRWLDSWYRSKTRRCISCIRYARTMATPAGTNSRCANDASRKVSPLEKTRGVGFREMNRN